MAQTVEEIDAELVETHQRLVDADLRGDGPEVTKLWLRLDELLDARIHIPLQRRPSE